jgi:catechol 2,3-dioxygenase-like lactoylglutathione lyase family enzyme
LAVRITSIDHVQLAMPPGQEQRATDFYSGLLGLRRVAKPPNLETRGGCWFEGGAVKLHLGVEPGFRPAKKAHVALLIEGLADLAQRLAAAGVAVRADEPLEGYDRVYVDDTFGNRLELMEISRTSPPGPVEVRAATPADRHWISSFLQERWGSTTVLSRGRRHDAAKLPALVAEAAGPGGPGLGLATFRIEGDELELVTIDAVIADAGVGSALLAAAKELAAVEGCRRLWLITTNDNLDALGFYQRRGLRLAAVHRDAVDRAREIKPQIPAVGSSGNDIHDELELVFRVS